MELITKPCQGGKTFINIEEIKGNIQDINIVLNRNISQDNIQFVSRLENIKDHAFIFSSTSDECKNSDKAFRLLTTKNKRIMICCQNDKRFRDIDNLLEDINEPIYIHIDEADEKINLLNEYIDRWNTYNNIKIIFYTATPNKLIELYPNIVRRRYSCDPNKYVSLINDCNFIEYKDVFGVESIGYIDNILKNININIRKKQKFLIPAGRTKKKHIELKNRLIKEYNCNVIVINGDGINLYLEDNVINYKDSKESLEKLLPKIYKKNKLKKKPLAITGEICIGRATTFNSKKFQITDAIFSHKHVNKNTDNMYQLAGRLCGNYKEYLKQKPNIYCTPEFKESVINSESEVLITLDFDLIDDVELTSQHAIMNTLPKKIK
jgi:hypothetical protein